MNDLPLNDPPLNDLMNRPDRRPRNPAPWACLLTAWAVAFTMAFCVACGPAENAETDPSDDEAAVEEMAEETSEAAAPSVPPSEWMGEAALGRDADDAGNIPADLRADRFAPGDVVFVSVPVDGAPVDSSVTVAFVAEDGTSLGEDAKKVPLGAESLLFYAADTSSWAPGPYRVEVQVPGASPEVVQTLPFEIAGG